MRYDIPQLPPQQPPEGQLEAEEAADLALTANVESIFWSFFEPQPGQTGVSPSEKTRCSETFPQSEHRYSKRAIVFSSSMAQGLLSEIVMY